MQPLLLLILLGSCKKDETKTTETIPTTNPPSDSISFKGKWGRRFYAGPANPHDVTYQIYEDSIRYTLTGNIGQANYKMVRDTFITTNNRWIGHTNAGTYYLIFVKNITPDSITIFKRESPNIQEALNAAVPPPTTTMNHGWNIFKKK